MANVYTPKPGAKERLLKNEPGVQSELDSCAQTVWSNAISGSRYGNGKHYAYHTKSYRNNAGFPHASVFISWKSKSNAFERALDVLRNSL